MSSGQPNTYPEGKKKRTIKVLDEIEKKIKTFKIYNMNNKKENYFGSSKS
jgi:hypothetical protein